MFFPFFITFIVEQTSILEKIPIKPSWIGFSCNIFLANSPLSISFPYKNWYGLLLILAIFSMCSQSDLVTFSAYSPKSFNKTLLWDKKYPIWLILDNCKE